MTTPHERTLAVMRTREFLRDLADPQITPRLPLRVRQRALSLLKHLPDAAGLSLASDKAPQVFGKLEDWTR